MSEINAEVSEMKIVSDPKVIKRDGRVAEFEEKKFARAIRNAMKRTEAGVDEEIIDRVMGSFRTSKLFKEKTEIDVDEIQDFIETALMKSSRKDAAKEFIKNRLERNKERDKKSKLMKDIKAKLEGTAIENQNANLDENSFGGRMGEANRIVTKDYALKYCMSEMSRKNHEENRIYIHDLDSYAVGMHNCLTIPFDYLLAHGFNTRQTDVRPANSVNTAFQLVAVIFQLQSLQQFGGVSGSHIDWTMVPYVRKSFYKHYIDGLVFIKGEELSEGEQKKKFKELDSMGLGIEDELFKKDPVVYRYALAMTKKETRQAVEGCYHNLNTLQSRSGNQLPFTSLNYGTCTLPEGRMVTKALLEVSIDGLGIYHRTSIFPCGIFQCMKGVNRKPGDPNYDLFKLALKSTSQRLYPNYANVDWSGNAGYDINDPKTYFSTMGCRTANGMDINGLGQLKDGRGNLCPVTIIMPTLAMEAEGDTEKFMELLDKSISDARDMLIERFNWMCKQNPASAKFMYENGLMAGYVPEEGIISALKHGTLTIGQLGLAETLQILIGKDHTTPEGMELAKRIEQLYKTRCAEFKQKYKLNFGVYYTPAENLCYTALKKFREKYGMIPNVSDKEFFTNSMHVPVWVDIDPFEKIDIESQLTGYSNAGCITYVELPSTSKHNIEAIETLVNYAMDHDIPYFAINVPNDRCCECGYTDEINEECPMCGSHKIERLRRVTGYLTGNYTTAFNLGKQDEVEHRVKHIKS
jgi:ribonucleoside-triphosphate reductase